MTDYEFDKKGGLRTTAIVYGGTRLIIGMYLLTAAAIIIFGVALVLSASIEVRILAVIMITYALIFTIATRNRLRGNQLMLNKNWILVPFGCLTFVFFCLGLFKIVT